MKRYVITAGDFEALDLAVTVLRDIIKSEGSSVDKDVLKAFHLLAPIIPLELSQVLTQTDEEEEAIYGV